MKGEAGVPGGQGWNGAESQMSSGWAKGIQTAESRARSPQSRRVAPRREERQRQMQA